MKRKNAVHAALLTTALIAGTAIPAFASGGTDDGTAADQALAAVQKATGTTGIAGAGTQSAVMATERGSVTVSTPTSAEKPVSVAASDGSAVTMALPAAVDTAGQHTSTSPSRPPSTVAPARWSGVTSAAGTTVYPDAAPQERRRP
ncbi:hypothetical protein SGL43_03993 [Streptomyces globisporus]|uniref:Uncharacterized protein n=1 Tax=Streptomyces globisporus TaxID=1908 RepID=A0ABM9H053_STRGL|nr:hypothetical protein [Streptomyces globisporus]CAH9416956.1 hypothetical protein SGL43_03993 [Streptomyces globisporus]